MKRLNDYKMRLMLVGFVAAIVLGGGGHANAVIILGEPTNPMPVINNDGDVQECDISHDGLELYYASARTGGYGGNDLWVSKRETLDSPWQEPVNLGPLVNTSQGEIEPSISGDGLELYFASAEDYYTRVCTRPSTDAPWGSPILLLELGDAWRPDISADGLSLYFNSTRVITYGGSDIWMATRTTKYDEWGEPVNLGPNVNSSGDDFCPCISTDGLTLLFDRGYRSMWGTTRRSINDDWGPAVQLPFKNPPGNFFGPSLSPDGSTVYFEATAAWWGGFGHNDIFQMKFIPIVDFNSDEIVNAMDMCILVDNWHTENTLCDIAPLPLGDGFVDVQDLVVLAEHLFEDYRLMAHWKLDEIEGIIAYESIVNKDATCHGEPIWQPDGGKVGGALQFDGIDDYVSTPFVLNPGEVSFSATAWIRGGAPGQVIISQADAEGQSAIESGSTWLGINPSNGGLMSSLMDIFFGPLESESVVADEQWHHVGLIYDFNTMKRHLYVDGAEVAVDAGFVGGVQSTAGLYIGAGQTLDAGSFFSGLIDDVRIYNKALTPEEIATLAR